MRSSPTPARKRILVLGGGRIGQVHARALSQIPEAEIAGICDPNPERAKYIADHYGITPFTDPQKAMSAQPWDAIIIGSPSHTHLDMVRLAAEHGLHIFCEKPLALNKQDIETAILACQKARVALQIGFNRRFDPNAIEIAKNVHAGNLGQVLSLRIINRDPSPPPRSFIRTSGGLFHDMAIHDFDLARYLLREDAEEVMAMGACLIDPMFAEEGDHDVGACLLRFKSGIIGTIEITRATPYGYDQRIEVLGTKSALESENQTANRVIHRDPRGQAEPVALPHFLERYEIAFRRQIESFLAALASPDPLASVKVTGLDALQAHLIAEAVAHSCRTGKPVKVEKLGAFPPHTS